MTNLLETKIGETGTYAEPYIQDFRREISPDAAKIEL